MASAALKRLIEGDIRYDKVLLDMVSEVGERYGKRFDKFALFGYSGGGQYVNRFAYVHPERLWAASIGAPGNVTVLDHNKDWWLGLGGFERQFGKPFDLAALQRVPVQMIVGRADLETWEITVPKGSAMYLPGINDAGATRPERLRTLKASFEAAGVQVRFDELDNIAHNGMQVVEVVWKDFCADTARDARRRINTWLPRQRGDKDPESHLFDRDRRHVRMVRLHGVLVFFEHDRAGVFWRRRPR